MKKKYYVQTLFEETATALDEARPLEVRINELIGTASELGWEFLSFVPIQFTSQGGSRAIGLLFFSQNITD